MAENPPVWSRTHKFWYANDTYKTSLAKNFKNKNGKNGGLKFSDLLVKFLFSRYRLKILNIPSNLSSKTSV